MERSEEIRILVKESIERRSRQIAFVTAKKLLPHFSKANEAQAKEVLLYIGSLSQLRAVVGGRLSTLKSRWLACGFPLKEHRGEDKKAYTLDVHAWSDMFAWLRERGYEASLIDEENEESYFSLKQVDKSE